MHNVRKSNIFSCLIFLLTVATFSACGGSSSSSTSIPSSSTVYYVHNLVFKNGTTLSTGYNAFGQLGSGNLDQRSVAGPLSQYFPFKGFATGGNHSVAFINNSTVRSWGYNYTGELGNGTTTFSSVPIKTNIHISGVKAVAAGAFHSLALTGDGRLWAWGNNSYGQLGYSTTINVNDVISDPRFSMTPKPVGSIAGGADLTGVTAVAANGYNSMALQSGNVLAWGDNGSGQLGVPPDIRPSSVNPDIVLPLPAGDITAIAAGSAFSYAVARDTTVWAWGNNSNGQLGNGTILNYAGVQIPAGCTAVSGVNAYVPAQVMKVGAIPLTDVEQVAAGGQHGLARLKDGSVWAWGADLYGQLGNSSVTGNNCFAVRVELKDASGNDLIAKDIRAFGLSSMAMTEDGAWYVWGNNLFGQLGIGTDGVNSTVLTPVKMSGF